MVSFSDPQKNVERFGITEGMRVADFGSGSGHYTHALAEAVGSSGTVYAIDIQQGLLKKVKDLSRKEYKDTIEVLWGNVENLRGSKLPDTLLHAVVMGNALFQFDNKETALREAYRVLKQKGRLFIVDWSDSFGGLGPESENVVSEESARALSEKAGFSFERSIPAGAHHYGLVFRKI